MTAEVTNTDVTNSQPPEGTTTRSRSSEGFLKWKKIVIFGLIGLVVLGVVIIVVLLLSKPNNDSGSGSNGNVDEETSAFYVSKNIDWLYRDDENYTFDDASNEYRKQMSSGGDEYRISIGFYYARFVMENTGDLEVAVAIMKEVEPLIKDDNNRVNYYATLRSFYDGVNEEMYNYYNDLITNLVRVEDNNESNTNE